MIETINHIADKWLAWQTAMLWQVAVLIAIVAAVDLLIRKWAWPQVRYALWLLILLKLVLPPTIALPTSLTARIPVLVEKTVKVQFTRPPAATLPPVPVTQYRFGPAFGAEAPVESARINPPILTESPMPPAITPHTTPLASTTIAPEPPGLSLKVYALLAWLGGVVVLAGWLTGRLRRFRREHLKNTNNTNALPRKFGALLEQTAAQLKLKKLPRVILTDKVKGPAVFGIFRPVLLMPADKVARLASRDIEHILLHELAHIKRGDLFVHAVSMILQIAYWFNPLIWLTRKPLQSLRELCCDATVAKVLKDKTSGYRETLLETARQLLAEPVTVGMGLLGLFENSHRLLDRLKWLEKKTWKNRPLRIALIGVLVGVMLSCVLPMAKAQNLTHHARKVMKSANRKAHELNHAYIGTEHILLALIHNDKGVAARILKNLDIDTEDVPIEISKLVKSGSTTVTKKRLPQTPRAESVMLYAREAADSLNHDYVSTEHILLGVTRVKDGIAAQVLANLGAEYADVRRQVLKLVGPGPIKGGHPTLVISGIVKDAATGLPIAGTKVGDDGYADGIRCTVTESDGTYAYLTWPEHHSIKADADGYKPQRETLYKGHFDFKKETVEQVINFQLTPENTSAKPDVNADARVEVERPETVSNTEKTGDFKADLSNGVTLELLGICRHPGQAEQWWAPDGKMLSDVFGEFADSALKTPNNYQHYKFAFRAPASGDIKYRWDIDGMRECTTLSSLGKPADKMMPIKAYLASFPKDLKNTTVRVGATTGQWKTLSTVRRGSAVSIGYYGKHEYTIKQPYQEGRHIYIPVVHTFVAAQKEYAVRMIALDKSGKTLALFPSGTGGNQLVNMTYKIYGVPFESIECFQLQIQKYQWAEFRNVSLEPGVKADVRVEGEKESPKAKAGSTLEFRLAADLTPTQAEGLQGPDADPAGFKWLALINHENNSWYKNLPHRRVKDTVYLLVSDQASQTMLADGTWGLVKSSVTHDDISRPAVYVWFNESGSRRFLALTKGNIGRKLAICIDGKINSAPQIMMAISKRAVITGNFTEPQAEELARALQKGMSQKNTSPPGKVRTAVLLPNMHKVLDLSTDTIIDIPVEEKTSEECLKYAEQNCGCGIMFDHDGDLSHLGFINVLHVDRFTTIKNGLRMMSFVSKNMPQDVVVTASDGKRYRIQITKAENEGCHLSYHQLPGVKTADISSGFTATLPNGVTVELLGVCEYPSDGRQWWSPDGKMIGRPYEKLSTTYVEPNYKLYELVCRVDGADDILTRITLNDHVKGCFGMSLLVKKAGGIQLPNADDCYSVIISCEQETEQADVTMLIGSDSHWEPVTFKNVSLRPGVKTAVQVEGGDGLSSSAEVRQVDRVSYQSALELVHAFIKFAQDGDPKAGEMFAEEMTPECVRLLDWWGGTDVRTEIEAEFDRMRSEFQAGLTQEQKQFYSKVRIWQDRGKDVTHNGNRGYVRLLNSSKNKSWIRTLLLQKTADGSWRIGGLHYSTSKPMSNDGVYDFLANSPATHPAWGELIEFNVSAEDIRRGCYVDFDKRRLYKAPSGAAGRQWLIQNGIDGKCDAGEARGSGGLKGIDLMASGTAHIRSLITPLNVQLMSRQWSPLGDGVGMLAFKTREGNIGIMIVGGNAEDYCIRFKMLDPSYLKSQAKVLESMRSDPYQTAAYVLACMRERHLGLDPGEHGFIRNQDVIKIGVNKRTDRLDNIYVAANSALAITSRSRQDDYHRLALFLDKEKGQWTVNDIQVEKKSEEGTRLKKFLKDHSGQIKPSDTLNYRSEEKPAVQIEGEKAEEIDKKTTTSSPFTATLPNGVTVRLAAICRHSSAANQWWRPDGTLRDDPIYVSQESSFDVDEEYYAFVVTIENTMQPDVRWAAIRGVTGPRIGLRVVHTPGFDLTEKLSFHGMKAQFADDARSTTIKLQIACDPWRAQATYDGRYILGTPDPEKGIYFAESYETAEGVKVAFSHKIEGVITRLAADVTGGSRGYSYARLQTVEAPDGSQRTLGLFKGVKLGNIKSFRLETRPYRYVTFQAVPLRPNTRIKTHPPDEKMPYDLTKPSDYMRRYLDNWKTEPQNDYNVKRYEIVDEYTLRGDTGAVACVFVTTTSQNTARPGYFYSDDRFYFLYRWHFDEWEGIYHTDYFRSSSPQQTAADLEKCRGSRCPSYLNRIEQGYISAGNQTRQPPEPRMPYYISEPKTPLGQLTLRHFITIVAHEDDSPIFADEEDSINYNGAKISWQELERIIENLADKSTTVLEVATQLTVETVRSGNTNRRARNDFYFAKSWQKAARLVTKYGLEYLSFIGEHQPDSPRGPVSLRFEDKLVFAKEIPLGLPSFEDEEKTMLDIRSVKFQKSEQGMDATIKFGAVTYPPKSWEISVKLLDEHGKQLNSVVQTCDNGGLVLGDPLNTTGELTFSFEKTEDSPSPARFQVELREFLNTAPGVKTNVQIEVESEEKSGVVGIQDSSLGKNTSAEAAFIIQKVLDRYAAIKTYSAIGELLSDVDRPREAMDAMPGMATKMLQLMGKQQLKSIFTIKMARPNLYCVEWNEHIDTGSSKVGNAWSVGSGSYGLILGKEKSFEKPLRALIGTAGNMGRVQSSLFFDTSLNTLRVLRDLSQQQDGQLEGVDCYVISGSRHRVTYTYWVSKKDFLIRRYKSVSGGDGKPVEGGGPELTDEIIKRSLKAMDKETTPEEIAKMRAMLTAANETASKVKVTNTETYRNIILDQPISKEQFVPSKDIDEITEELKNLRAQYINRLKNISPTDPNFKTDVEIETKQKVDDNSGWKDLVLPDMDGSDSPAMLALDTHELVAIHLDNDQASDEKWIRQMQKTPDRFYLFYEEASNKTGFIIGTAPAIFHFGRIDGEGSIPPKPVFQFFSKTLPDTFSMTAPDGKVYEFTVLQADSKSCRLRYRLLARVKTEVQVEGESAAGNNEVEGASESTPAEATVIEDTLEFILTEHNPKESLNSTRLKRSVQTLIDANAIATVPVLAEFIVSTRGRKNYLRSAALEVVSAIGDANVVDLLIEEYDSARYGNKAVVDGLRRLAPRKFSKKLLQDIQSGKNLLESMRIFARVGDSSMIPEVIALLDSPQRGAAARILYWMPDKRAIPALRKALTLPGTHDFSTHAYAAHALHYLGVDEGLEVLIRDLYEAPRTVNPRSTGRAIAAIAGEGALELFRPLLEDSNSRVRRNALVAIDGLLDNRDNSAPENSLARRKANVMQPDKFLQLCYPLLADEDGNVAAMAHHVFMRAIPALSQAPAADKGVAVSIAKTLWSEFFTDPERQKQLLGGRQLVNKGRPVVLMFSEGTISSSEADNELSQHSDIRFAPPSQEYFVLCTDDEIRITKTISPDTPGQRASRISVAEVYQVGPFCMVTLHPFPRIIHVLLRQEDGDWKWGALLGHTHIDIY